MVFAFATFALCLAVILGLYWVLIVRPESEQARAVTNRLSKLDAPRVATAGVATATTRLSSVPAMEVLLKRNARFTGAIEQLILEAGLKMTVGVFLALSFACAAAGWAFGMLVLQLLSAGLVFAAAAAFAPYAVVRYKRTKRLQTFEEQFPEAIDLIARSLRAGHAFTTGLGIAAEELPPPVGGEFKLVYDQQNFGMSMPDALRAMARRVPVLDARFFVTAVLTQRESGGNLAEVLDNLSSVMRDRFKVKRQIRVISAHGRLSGWILSLVPPCLAGFLFFIQPEFMRILVDDPIGLRLVFAAIALQLTGTYIISRLVKIEY
jgi:tight adherence protein B